jgi:hypothetical protein
MLGNVLDVLQVQIIISGSIPKGICPNGGVVVCFSLDEYANDVTNSDDEVIR